MTKPALLFVHLVCISAWFGCVLTEILYEHSIGPDWTMRRFVAQLHWTTDCWIEAPALVGALVTGILLLPMSETIPVLVAKIAFGLLAIVSNVVCMWIVRRRTGAAQAEDGPRYEALDRWQHRIGAGVLVGIVGALVTGGMRYATMIY